MSVLPLIGREHAVQLVHELLARASAGEGGALVVDGAPGAGRSRLLTVAIEAGEQRGFEVRRAVGRPVERDVDGALVSQLLGTHDTSPPAVHAAFTATRDRPLLVAVDDLQHCDAVSVMAVAYAARRLVGSSVAMLLAMGAETVTDWPPHVLDGLPLHHLDGLSADEVAALFAQAVGPVDARVAERVCELTGGNPLAVLELARSSTAEQRAGSAPFPELPTVSDVVVRSFAGPLTTLPDATRRVLCVLAAEPGGRSDVVARALAVLGERLEAIEPAESAGIVRVDGDRFVFDHPMRRVVAYASLALPSRRAVHRALAAAWDGPGDGNERLRHLIAGAVGPDDELADDVQRLAEHLERTGRAREAAEAWRQAASLSVAPGRASARTAAAAKMDAAAARPTRSSGRAAVGPLAALTAAELRVARVVAEGLSNRQAAERLFLSLKTIDAHLQSIFRKLAVNTRAQLAVLVTRHDEPNAGAAR